MFLINKESGVTSFKEVSRVRRKLGIKKAGHAGTLDQFASGLLLILTGPEHSGLGRLRSTPFRE